MLIRRRSCLVWPLPCPQGFMAEFIMKLIASGTLDIESLTSEFRATRKKFLVFLWDTDDVCGVIATVSA